ncbi:MAG: DUF1549 domain-containing protein, partial [Planctomycetes bacterium]|nr:DUF1549 domain-containing protein [Planctomycetota bacterium]
MPGRLRCDAPLRVAAIAALLSVLGTAAARTAACDEGRPIDFDRDVRPLLSDRCFQCHGPDVGQRQADLRLDREDAVFAEREGRHIVSRGKPGESELYRRITATDAAERMPPADARRPLNAAEIDVLRRWIAEGAPWERHWSFVPPKRAVPPEVKHAPSSRNPIDRFVLARLEQEGLTSSAEADRETLIRRVTLDLTGLPPTPEAVDEFLADERPDAYERVVDRLLASPRYGERMAAQWLDLARYADTSGYQSDGPRDMWRWRDWVIDAYNAGMPFDRFTVEQIAGDLLPPPLPPLSKGGENSLPPLSKGGNGGVEQVMATAFNRNHRGNAEGGIVPEEYQVEYVVDRVDTTATVWLGLTLGCARCHDHKFDPVTQKEFYRVFAYFNNIPEHGRAIKEGNSPPYIQAPTVEQATKQRRLEDDLADARSRFRQLLPRLHAELSSWEATAQATTQESRAAQHKSFGTNEATDEQAKTWLPRRDLLARFPLDAPDAPDAESELVSATDDAPVVAPRPMPVRFVDGSPVFADGKNAEAAVLDGSCFLEAGDVGNFGYFDKFSFRVWIKPENIAAGTILSRMTDVEHGDGYAIALADGRLQVNLVKRWLDDAIRVETERRLEPDRWHHIAVTYDGSRVAGGISVYIDGRPEKLIVRLDAINQSFSTAEPFRIGGGNGPGGRFHGRIDDVRIYGRDLTPE